TLWERPQEFSYAIALSDMKEHYATRYHFPSPACGRRCPTGRMRVLVQQAAACLEERKGGSIALVNLRAWREIDRRTPSPGALPQASGRRGNLPAPAKVGHM